jgi:hypothetical protein
MTRLADLVRFYTLLGGPGIGILGTTAIVATAPDAGFRYEQHDAHVRCLVSGAAVAWGDAIAVAYDKAPHEGWLDR